MKYAKVALIGGAGFVGRHLTHHLNNRGYRCRVLTRHAHRQAGLRLSAEVVEADPYDLEDLSGAIRGCDGVVNLVGILNETGFDGSGFRRAHVDLARLVMEACKAEGVPRLLHMSALNADAGAAKSHYLRTKGEAEDLVHDGSTEQLIRYYRTHQDG